MNLNLKLIATLPFYLLLASCSNDAKTAQTHPDSQSETSAQHSTDVLRIATAANLAGVLTAVIDAYETSDTQTSKNQKL